MTPTRISMGRGIWHVVVDGSGVDMSGVACCLLCVAVFSVRPIWADAPIALCVLHALDILQSSLQRVALVNQEFRNCCLHCQRFMPSYAISSLVYSHCREYEGTVLSVGSYVFLDVDWLAKVLEPLLNHKGIEDRGGTRSFGDVEVTQQWQEYSLRKLQGKGILEQRLAAFLWPGYTEHVLAALARIGLTFPCPGDDDGGLVVLLRLPETRPLYVGQHIANFNEGHGQKSLTMHWKMPYGVPPGGIERIVSRCSSLGKTSKFWRFGALVRVGATRKEGEKGDDGVERSWFLLEYDSYGQELVVSVWGDLKKAAAWAILSYISAVVREMTQQYPGLRWEAFVGCPDHPGEAMYIAEVRRAGCERVAVSGNGLLTERYPETSRPKSWALTTPFLRSLQVLSLSRHLQVAAQDATLASIQVRHVR